MKTTWVGAEFRSFDLDGIPNCVGVHMRVLFLVLTLLGAGTSAEADPRPFRAGVTRIAVQDLVPFDALVAYPTDVTEVHFQDGPHTIAASRDAPIASGAHFPVVLFSHGGGGTIKAGGTPAPYADLLTSLAREGFIVVAPFHPGSRLPREALEDRPRQIHKALDAILADPRFATHADPNRLGMMGFSYGGAVTLIIAGAVPSLAHLAVYCRNRTDDPMACDGVPTDGSLANAVGRKSPYTLAVKALVLLEPWGSLFDRTGLTSLDMPTLLYRAEGSALQADGNILALAAALPHPPRQETVPGGHFIFFGPCLPALETDAPAVCKDAPGIDRAAVHRRINVEIGDFLRRNL
ncbi:dienelactone hydrolase [Bradyrhizobium xenonodulans]|uniref:Dienelactone hydrolase n=1 Tax=Bradyrhizobium xenonodulans TaxID=2736875 RepID=A0ABY7MPY0_9BRAD|nr:dienelactone hydrolase [Bradyrhizobium xenonodulans]WBL80460.1 dienelactone hydrolase [Bradyrhizobium xenonodulans]